MPDPESGRPPGAGGSTPAAVPCTECPLRPLPCFAPMSEAEVAFMMRFKKGELRVPAGRVILAQGEPSVHVYTALHGMGLRARTLPEGQRQVLNFVFPGDLLGLQAGLMDAMGHSVEASSDMVLCVFDRAELWRMFRNQPARAWSVAWAAAVEETLLGEALATVGQRGASGRIAWAVTRIARRFAALGIGEGGVLPMPWRQQDLADALGLSLVHTNKTLARFREQGLLRWTEGRLHLGDPAALAGLAGLPPASASPEPALRPLI